MKISGKSNSLRDFKRSPLRFSVLFIACILLCSCASSGKITGDTQKREVQEFLQKNTRLYEAKEREKFLKSFSDEYYPSYKETAERVEDFLLNHSNINCDIRIERILTSGQQSSVDIKWFKSYVDNRGNPVQRQGEATLIFKVSRGRLLLISIRGDNPFI